MRGLCGLILVLAVAGGLLWGMHAWANAESAFHETEALLGFLIATVAAGAGFVGAVVDEASKRTAAPTVAAAAAEPKKEEK